MSAPLARFIFLTSMFHPLSSESRALIISHVRQSTKTVDSSALHFDVSSLVRRNPVRSLLSLVTSSSSQRTVLVLLLAVANLILTLRDSKYFGTSDGSVEFGAVLMCLNLFPSNVNVQTASKLSSFLSLFDDTEELKLDSTVQASNDENKWKKQRSIPTRNENGISPDLLSPCAVSWLDSLTREHIKSDELNPSYFDLLVTILKRHNVFSLVSLQVFFLHFLLIL